MKKFTEKKCWGHPDFAQLAQSKCTWTCHKSRFVQDCFLRKCRRLAGSQKPDPHFLREQCEQDVITHPTPPHSTGTKHTKAGGVLQAASQLHVQKIVALPDAAPP